MARLHRLIGGLRLKFFFSVLFFCVGPAGIVKANSTGAPPGLTGDFGEKDCRLCHGYGQGGRGLVGVDIAALPTEYVPGRRYEMLVNAHELGASWFGFQLSARTEADGKQAGNLIPGESTKIVTGENGIDYLTHSRPAATYGSATWSFTWEAPDLPVGTVRFSVACVSGVEHYWSNAWTYTLRSPSNLSSSLGSAIFPQVVVGGGYSSVFNISNVGGEELSGHLILKSSAGLPLEAIFEPPFAQASAVGVVQVHIPSGGTVRISAGRPDLDEPKQGWGQFITLSAKPEGVVRIEHRSGELVDRVFAMRAAEMLNSATIPVDDEAALNRFTGYAIVNPGSEGIGLKLYLLDTEGTVQATIVKPLQLAAGQQFAKFLWEEVRDPAFKFQGSVVVTAADGKKFSVAALIQNRGLFSALPVIPGKTPQIPD